MTIFKQWIQEGKALFEQSKDLVFKKAKKGESFQFSSALQPATISTVTEGSSLAPTQFMMTQEGRDLARKLPYQFVTKHLVLPFAIQDRFLIVAVSDLLNLEPLEEVALIYQAPVRSVKVSTEELMNAIHYVFEEQAESASDLMRGLGSDALGKEGEVAVFDLLDDRAGEASIIKLLNLILREAIQQSASDIHFEPNEDGLKIRFRIDGVLQARHAPPLEFQSQLLTRLKVMAKLDIAEHRLPQDGRIKLRMGRREIDFRVSTVPTTGGERIVLRILDKGNLILGLESMGMLDRVAREFNRLIRLPEGIVLVTGPTGSGKTTTLYSALTDLKSETSNIMTVEDPVEYQLKEIAQIGVHPKINLTFSTGLRHILRQDPDIIMIGEIRDRETAEIAIQASLTGHLVLSTLHTNDAPSAITRLVDMGVEPYLLSSTVVGVLAQRLVRKICPCCRQSVTPSVEELKSLGVEPRESLKFFEGAGCSECFGTGYKGRVGLYELMVVTPKLQKQIVTSADAIQLRELAVQSGLVSLRDHGRVLVMEGVTTVKEVLRVTRGLDE